jgi:hypothetical protein
LIDQVAIITAFCGNFQCISTISNAGIIECAENVAFLTDAFFYNDAELKISECAGQTKEGIVDNG